MKPTTYLQIMAIARLISNAETLVTIELAKNRGVKRALNYLEYILKSGQSDCVLSAIAGLLRAIHACSSGTEMRALISTLFPDMRLGEEYLSGLFAADGHFSITVLPNGTVTFEVKVTQRDHSEGVLLAVQEYFGCGTIVIDNREDKTLKWHVTDPHLIKSNVLPTLLKTGLHTSKDMDLADFAEALDLRLESGEDLTRVLGPITVLSSRMNNRRPLVDRYDYLEKNLPVITGGWFSGFIEGDGHFSIETSQGFKFVTEIKQSGHDVAILLAIKEFFNGGTIWPTKVGYERDKAVQPKRVYRLRLRGPDAVIDLLNANPLVTAKRLDFQDWKMARLLCKAKYHLTPEGKALIKKIKSDMNDGRLKAGCLTPGWEHFFTKTGRAK